MVAAGLDSPVPTVYEPEQLRGSITMRDAVEAVRVGFLDWAGNSGLNAARQRIHAPSGVRVSIHPGIAPSLGVGGLLTHCEWVQPSSGEQRYGGVALPVTVLFSAEDAHLKAILYGSITCRELPNCASPVAIRTAAVSALGTHALARSDARSLGILGTGDQARHHLLAFAALRDLDEVVVFGRNQERLAEFCTEMSDLLGSEVRPVDSAEAAVRRRDIVLTATNSSVPVLDGAWLSPGQHVTSIVGSNVGLLKAGHVAVKRRELDDETVRRAARIGIVSREQAIRDEQADIYEQIERGVSSWDRVLDLTELLSAAEPPRDSDDDITVFKNNAGMGIADVSLAAKVVDLLS